MIRAVLFDVFETLVTHYRTPLYFSEEIARDLGLPLEQFRTLWRASESDRSTGLPLDTCLARILSSCGRDPAPDKIRRIVDKRLETKRLCFASMRSDIPVMLRRLRSGGLKIGIVSNCFSEEVTAIRESILSSLTDAMALSFEEGVEKPDPELFLRCAHRLGVTPEACVYVGDGGSRELPAAASVGMRTYQALWYFADSGLKHGPVAHNTIPAETPEILMDLVFEALLDN